MTDAANLGLAVHAALADRGNGGDGKHALYAAQYEVDAGEVLRLADIGWEVRGEILNAAVKGHSGPPKTSAEVALSADLCPELRLTGHLDYLIRAGKRAIVPEHKAGRRGDLSPPEHQIKGYAWLVLMCFPEIEHVTGVALWLHERATTTYQMARSDMNAWRDELVAKLTESNPKYGPSESTCRYCPYEATCEARLALLGGALAVIDLFSGVIVIDGKPGGGITASRLLQAYEATAAIEARLKHFRTELRAQIFRGGPVEADGQELYLKETAPRTIDLQRAWDVLTARLSLDEISRCVKVGVGDVISAVRSHADRGSKKKAEDAFLEALAKENAVTYTTQHRLTLRTVEE